ncbi:MAG: PAS domain S-box protein [Rhizobiales bacterium]|nr:PAS domain S-box protein [Hyphomicrobiales bacterium]
MNHKSPAVLSASILPPIIAGLFALAVFIVDTMTPLDIAVAVLYVLVVLIAANYFQFRGVLLVSMGCLALTVVGYLATHGFFTDTGALARCIMSISAIGATTLLALKNQSANAALRERARLLDLTHDTIFVRDMNDVISYWNRGAEELYGWRRDEAVGKVSHQLLKTVFPTSLKEIKEALLRGGRWEGELIHVKRDGTRVTVSSRWSLDHDEGGRPISIMETNNDITERNQAQQSLHRAQAELAHVNRVATLGELTASIAHEVNQPLTGVVTNGSACLRLLDLDPPDVEEVRSGIESIINDGMRASEVIQRLRALSKKTDLNMVPLNINDVVSDVLRLLQREIFDHLVSLKIELAAPQSCVVGDRVQLQQVIINLVMNGMEAMADVTDRPRELVIRSSQHEADQVLVEVQDRGRGIEPKNVDRVFNAFFTTKPDGMGIGLSVCRSIIQTHGGRIWVLPNTDGAGATFRVTLPCSPDSLPRKADAASPPAAA